LTLRVRCGGDRPEPTREENEMYAKCVMVLLATAVTGWLVAPAAAEKSKMGCEMGSEVWSATEGKCIPGTPKYPRKAPKSPAKAMQPKQA
jgi:hypothetical protein